MSCRHYQYLHFSPFTFVKIMSTLFLCLAVSNSYAVCCIQYARLGLLCCKSQYAESRLFFYSSSHSMFHSSINHVSNVSLKIPKENLKQTQIVHMQYRGIKMNGQLKSSGLDEKCLCSYCDHCLLIANKHLGKCDCCLRLC